ncbi:transcriptional regulator, ArsR family [Kushneria avicenniae]|uniref:Transcriptional regulator, ArsR family n=1 Tax=Kushneria avicenniae TaxID=402385 RepID=A0A1I1LGM7_9GAMM|nr:metalloregulator ArsR/SmtB family transcription factor [Kushneria avicenniae]SFC72096.1 transcriptional regulator, ArsR family [Kushneria avicenniae]
MDNETAIDIFAALAQRTRLDAFKLLVRHEPEGLAAGELARHLEVPHNTLSAHLSVLSRAGLVVSQRQSRSIIYRASLDRMQETLAFLARDCCDGRPELCAPLLSPLQSEDCPEPEDPS